ncbi:DUF3105 domain-containing protein [Cryobacterium sp. TmT2-59]|uniref:DUF3105 domain-containing protein n=1 Tax=Cryobacterium sp. TmT2-59 TaxID=1259264 RepID=UPI001068FC00|nr:DUF3105 domain-containing protein [Cryobacterium sp. TmT2-59]TFC84473.1 DUF3105 domain-containing protein [Cryobacterium sp. TmT2-59]
MASKKNSADRQTIVAAARAEMKRSERRRSFWIYGSGAVVAIVVAAIVASVFVVNQQSKDAVTAAADKPISGVQSFDGLSRNHVNNEVAFPTLPPVGGDHSAELTNCGVYTQPVDTWRAVHSLEHGAVWITYRSDLPQDQIDTLTADAASNPYELLSPYPDRPAPVIVSAWGKQLQLDSVDDSRLPVFLQAYLQGPQTPEPGAPCSGGVQG